MDISQGINHVWRDIEDLRNAMQEPLSPRTPVLCKEGSGPIVCASTTCELQKPTEIVYVLTEVPQGVSKDSNSKHSLNAPLEHQHQSHNSKHRKHRQEDHSSETLARPVLGRSRSFSSESDNSSRSSKSSSGHPSQLVCSTRIK